MVVWLWSGIRGRVLGDRAAMFGVLTLLLVKLGLVLLPATAFWLSTRRLVRSRTANAWLYAATSVFSLVTLLGLAPWAFGIGKSHPLFFVLAAIAPAIWYGVVTLCNSTRHLRYDSDLERTVINVLSRLNEHRPKLAPLILERPEWPDAPKPVFRHSRPPNSSATSQRPANVEDDAPN